MKIKKPRHHELYKMMQANKKEDLLTRARTNKVESCRR